MAERHCCHSAGIAPMAHHSLEKCVKHDPYSPEKCVKSNWNSLEKCEKGHFLFVFLGKMRLSAFFWLTLQRQTQYAYGDVQTYL